MMNFRKITLAIIFMILLYSIAINSQAVTTDAKIATGSTPELSANILPEHSCFLGNAQEVTDKLNELINKYENICGVPERKEIADFANFAKTLGKLENEVKLGKVNAADLDVAVKFSATYTSMGTIKTANDLNFERLMANLQDEIVNYVHQQKLPTYYIDSIFRLVKYKRYFELMEQYPDKKVCLNTSAFDLQMIGDITSDPHEKKLNCNPKTSDEFIIDPLDFEEDGLALAFWVIEDATFSRDSGKNIAQGYVNNNKVFDAAYMKGSEFGMIINKFNINGQIKEVVSNSKCTGFLFVLMGIEKDCDHYRIDMTVRLPRENLRSFFQFKVGADIIENLKITFSKPPVAVTPKIYKHFTYSLKEENRIIVDSAGSVFTEISLLPSICSQIPNCNYFSTQTKKCEKCKPPTYLSEGKCVEVCPPTTYPVDGECKPCQKNCDTCKTADDCEKCVDPFHLLKLDATTNKANCVSECPAGMVLDEKYNECIPCTQDCLSCKKSDECNVCKNGFFLLEGKCVSNCPDGTFKVINPDQCKSCAVGCAKCDSLLKCENCQEGFFMKDGVCVKNCGNDYFASETAKKCEPCSEHCKLCENGKECKVCETGFYIDNETKTCTNDCKPTQTLYNGVCIWCGDKKNCDECDPSNIQVCKKCLSPTLLEEGKCVENCREGHYANDNAECVPCPTNCKTCTKDKCIVCEDSFYLLEDKNCPSNCPDGYIISGKTCIKCSDKTQCKKCTETNLEICTNCYAPDVLKEGKCEKECGNNYFLRDGECFKCVEGCNNCNDNFTCNKCDAGYLMKDNICVKDCGDGYAVKDGVCVKCTVENCITCPADNLDHCDKCNSENVLYNNKCYKQCPFETYKVEDQRICQDCPKDCLECKDGKTCEKCKSPRVLQDTECKSNCNEGFHEVMGVCNPCNKKDCKNCDDTLKSCTDCYSNHFLYNKECVTPCPEGTYENGKECSPCEKPCEKCKGSANQCTVCIEGFGMNKDGKCTDNCPTGTVMLSNRKCTDCLDVGCDKCNQKDISECIKCNETMVLLNGDCFKKCPDGFFNLSGECQPCLQGCHTCSSKITCETCDKPLFLKNKDSCVPDCGDGWIEFDEECKQCKGNCVKCNKDDLNHCTKCPEGLYLLEGKCIKDCPSKFWSDTSTYTCEPCEVKDCIECSSKGKICENCAPQILDNNRCVNDCPEGKVKKDGKCVQCEISNCKKCPSTGTDTCTECTSTLVLVDKFTCGKNCPNGFYADKETKTCKNCNDHCVDCDNSSTCKKCETGFYLENGVCVENCKDGSRKDIDRCTLCDTKYCKKCTEKDCLVCEPPHVLLNNECKDSCPDDHYYLEKENELKAPTCKPCSNFCKACDNGKTCLECDKPKLLDAEGKCVDDCKDGMVDVNGKCVPCAAGKECRKCSDKDLTECTDCKDKFYLKNKQCVSDCGEGYYEDNKRCEKCIDNCKVCHSGKVCDLCKDSFYLLDQLCVEECPCGTYHLEGKCINCADPNCEECTSDECKKCDENYFLENGVCRKECSPGYFKFNFLKCDKCGVHCINCLNQDDCKVCEKGFYLKNGICVNNCGSGYVATDSECKPCEPGCDVCSENNLQKCENCVDKKYLYMDKCVDACPNGFFSDNTSKTCLPCIENCLLCKDTASCDQCKDKYLYQSSINKCVTECVDGYRPDKSICSPCKVDGCKKCDANAEKCDECNSDKFKNGDTCVPQCPDKGFYVDIVAKECHPCPTECDECKNEKECKKCKQGFVLKNSACVNECDDGEVIVDGECHKCKTPNCSLCKATDLAVCEKCKENLVLSVAIVSGKPTYKCSEVCDEGFYTDLKYGKCEPCVDNCSKCTDSKTCEECKKGFLLENGLCLATCSKGHVERNGKCLPCEETNCLICDNISLKGCKKCDPPTKLKNEKCEKECGSDYFEVKVEDMVSCNPCVDHCSSCSNPKTCDVCNSGFYLKDGICVQDCGDGHAIVEGTKCEPCSQKECKKCSGNNLTKCDECVKPNFLTPQQTCVPNCGDKNFERQIPSSACIPCTDENCLVCSPENFCKKCNSPFVVFNTKCVKDCPDGYYADKENVCKPCSDNKCASCSAQNPEKCNQCDQGFFLNDKQCVSQCPRGTFPNAKNECQLCEAHCEECKNDTSCVVCTNPFLLDKNAHCTDSCERGFVEIKAKCEPCEDKDCVKCDSKDTKNCLECDPKLFLYKGDCPDSCPAKTVAVGKNCVDCEQHCDKCTDANTCVNCEKPFFEENGDCVSICKTGSQEVDGHCTPCADVDKCNKCKSDLKTCEECRSPYKIAEGKCIENCEDGFFYDSNLKKCVNCTTHCSVCENPNTCKKCTNPFLLNPVDSQCVEVCPDKFTPVVKDQKCVPCSNQNCKLCDVHNSNSCTDCPEKTYKFLKSNNEYDCLNKCPDGFYESADGKCNPCDPKCATCTDEKTCQLCKSPFVLIDTMCQSDCPKGSVNRNGACFKCSDSKCEVCNEVDLNKCLKCNQGILFNNLCIDNCPVGYRKDSTLNTCVKCPEHCAKCDENGCTDCDDKFYFMEKTKNCVNCVRPNLIVNQICSTCKVPGCNECGDTTEVCKVCDSTLILFEGKCLSSCQDGYYKDGITCKKCTDGCDKCSGENCSQCQKDLVLINGKCDKECPAGFANVNGICEPCTKKECLRCDNSVTECKKCNEKFILFDGNCVEFCPESYYLNIDKCEKCPDSCKKCDANGCHECHEPNKIKGKECVSNCGEKYFDKGTRCEPCNDINCLECSPENECKKCNNSTYLMVDLKKCTTVCPEGTYQDDTTRECKPCETGCATCTSTKCEDCKPGFFLNEGKCVTKCPDQFTNDKGRCVHCIDPNCLECLPESPNKCKTCQKGSLFEEHCLTECPKQTFEKNGNCIKCDPKCKTCDNETTCTSCVPPLIFHNNQCDSNCPDGKSAIDGKCISCADSNCKVCSSDINNCVECLSPFKLFDGVCQPDCPKGFFDDKKGICKRCSVGCETCDNELTCQICRPGFFLENNECVTYCRNDTFGDCSDHKCKKCDNACQNCVGPTSNDCVNCSSGFFRDIENCVPNTGCRDGTFANETNKECSPCRIPLCAQCSSATQCSKCIPGLQLQDNKCVYSHQIAPLVPTNEVISTTTYNNWNLPIDKVKGVGVGSPEVSFSFWARLLAPKQNGGDNVIFSVDNYPAYDYSFLIDDTSEKCKFVVALKSKVVMATETVSCSFANRYEWSFFYITIAHHSKDFDIGIHILNNNTWNDTTAKAINKDNVFDVLVKTAKFNFGNDSTPDLKELPDAIQFYDFEIMDYLPSDKELAPLIQNSPPFCDYFCTKCEKTCKMCVDGLPPLDDGRCRANGAFLNHGLNLINATPLNYNVKDLFSKNFASNKWAFTTWFYLQNPDFTKNVGIVDFNYLLPNKEYNTISVSYENNKFNVDGNNFDVVLNGNTWYYLMLGVSRKYLTFTLLDLKGFKVTKDLTTKDEIEFLWMDYKVIIAPSGWTGSVYDSFLYINNHPNDKQIEESEKALKCPENCDVCTRDLQCTTCAENFIKQDDGKCVDNTMNNVTNLIQRVDLWDKNTFSSPVNKQSNPVYTISLWLRKKTHSNLPTNNVHTLVSWKTENGIIPAIQETLLKDSDSQLSFLWLKNSESFTYKFDHEIYHYFHVTVTVDTKAKTLKYNVNGKNPINKTDSFSDTITDIILGDQNGEEANMEISLVDKYPRALSDTQIASIKEPIDCNPGCKECDLRNGKCLKCHNGVAGDSCSILLIGFSFSFIYSGTFPTYDKILQKDNYSNNFKSQEFPNGVNSLNYSVFSHLRFFQLTNSKDGERQRILSLGNGDVSDSPQGREIVALDLVFNNGSYQFEWLTNSSGQSKTVRETSLVPVAKKWYSLHAGINVEKKKFSYMLVENGGKRFTGELDLPEFPEKLQEYSEMRIFGVGDNIDKNYIVPRAQLQNAFFAVNSGFDPTVFDKYLAKFGIEADPTCDKNCELCTFNNKKQIICLSCLAGFNLKNGVCENPPNYGYVVLNKSLVTALTSYDLKTITKLVSGPSYSFSFFFRANYFSVGNQDIVSKPFTLTLSTLDKTSLSLTLNNLIKISVTQQQLTKWNNLIVTGENGQLCLSLANELDQTNYNTKCASGSITEFINYNVNPFKFQYQFYGVTVVNSKISNSVVDWPQLDCSKDCLSCIKNTCTSCLYGSDSTGSCKSQSEVLDDKDKTVSRNFPFEEVITSYSKLRSSSYTIEFIFKSTLPGVISKLAVLDVTYFEIHYSDKDGYEIRFNHINTGFGVVKVAYPNTNLVNSEHYVALVFDNNKLNYLLFNSKSNNVVGSIPITNNDYLVAGATLTFTNSVVRNIRFNEQALNINIIQSNVASNFKLVQNSCLEGNMYQCTQCDKNLALRLGLCSPSTSTAKVFLINEIIPISRWNTENKSLKINFGSTSLTSFTFSFWWRLDSLLPINQGVVNLSLVQKTQTQLLTLFYNTNNSFELSLSWQGATINKSVISDVFKEEEIYNWSHITIKTNSATGSIILSMYITKTDRTIEKVIKASSSALSAIATTGKVLYLNFGFSNDENVSFEISGVWFTENAEYSTDDIKNLRMSQPLSCDSPCKDKCSQGVCKASDRITDSINLGADTLVAADATKLLSVLKLNLFRPITEYKYIQTFDNYDISLELEVNTFLSSKYTNNKNVLFVIHKNNKLDYESLTMNSIIPDDLSRLYSLSLIHNNGKLLLYTDYIPWTNSVHSYEIPLSGRKLTDFTKVYVSISFNNNEKTARVLVIADDLLIMNDLGKSIVTPPLSNLSLVYNHPALSKFNLNLYRTGLLADMNANALDILSKTYTSNLCTTIDKNCAKCVNSDNNSVSSCLKCADGYALYNNACNPTEVNPK